MDRSQSLEKAVVGLLLIFALLTFFFPLITFQIPVLGSQDVSGYDIFSKMGVFHDKMQSVPKSSGEPEPEALRSPGNEPSLPISFQCIALIPLEVSLAFVCALIALPGCPGKFRRVHVKVACAVGSLSALAAILHLTVMNSDLHAWFKESMASSAELRGNAFANLAGIVAIAFQVKPGIGLYLLAVTLALAAFLCYSRLLETVAIEREPTGLPGPAGCTPERNVSSLNPLSEPRYAGVVFCCRCGAALADRAALCPACGLEQRRSLDPQVPSGEPTYSIVGIPTNPTQDESALVRTEPQPISRSSIISIVLVLVFLLVFALWIYSHDGPAEQSTVRQGKSQQGDSSADKVVQGVGLRDDWKKLEAHSDFDLTHLPHSLADAPLSNGERAQIYKVIDDRSFAEDHQREQQETLLSARVGSIGLAKDGSQQILVELSGMSANSPMWIFVRRGDRVQLALETGGVALIMRDSFSHGFRDLATAWHMGSGEYDYTVYRWNGAKYQEVDCYAEKSWSTPPVITDCSQVSSSLPSVATNSSGPSDNRELQTPPNYAGGNPASDGRTYSVALIVAASDIPLETQLFAQGRVASFGYAGMRSRPFAVIQDEQQPGKTLLCAMMADEGAQVVSLYHQGEIVQVSGSYMGILSLAGNPSMPTLSDCKVASPTDKVVRP